MLRIAVYIMLATIAHDSPKIRVSSGIVLTAVGFVLIHYEPGYILVRYFMETLGVMVQFFGLAPFVDPVLERKVKRE